MGGGNPKQREDRKSVDLRTLKSVGSNGEGHHLEKHGEEQRAIRGGCIPFSVSVGTMYIGNPLSMRRASRALTRTKKKRQQQQKSDQEGRSWMEEKNICG